MKEQAPGGPDKCVCPDCDYEVDKERGTPCRSMECPECGAKLVAGTETEETEEADPAWGAKKGERIRGRLFRGGGGRFTGGPSDEELGDIGVSREVSNTLLVLLKGERVDSKMVAELLGLGLVDEAGKLNKMGKATAEAMKAKDVDEVKRLLDAAKPEVAAGGGGGGAGGPTKDEIRTANRKEVIAQAVDELELPENVLNQFFDFADEVTSLSDDSLAKVAALGLIVLGKDGYYKTTVHGKKFLKAANKKLPGDAIAALKKAQQSVKAETEEAAMPMTDVRQIAASAIETALAVVKDTGEITVERAERLLYALEADLGKVSGVAEVATLLSAQAGVTEFVLVPDGEWMATDLLEALTKKVSGRTHVKGDFLVAEDPKKVTTWSLPVKVNGKVDHRLMGAAKAALTVGYRGNKYEGPGKAAAIKKLKALYKSEDMEWTVSEAAVGEVSSGLESYTSQVRSAFQAVFRRREAYSTDVVAEPYLWVKDIFFEHPDLGNAVIVDKDGVLLMVDYTQDEEGHFTFAAPEDWEQVKQTYVKVGTAEAEVIELTENADGIALGEVADFTGDFAELGIDATIESGRRAPVLVDFQIIKPGPGNKKHGHYYPREMLERDAPVFEGMDIFATDHLEKERNERTKVGRVQECPIRFTEAGAPVGRVIIYDPGQAEKTRNRSDAGELATMEGSIFASGKARQGRVNGKEYKIVETITQGKYLELVGKAGAGGVALNLTESDDGGDRVDKEKKTKPTPLPAQAGVEEVEIEETEGGDGEPGQSQVLAEKDVNEALAETNLPPFVKTVLAAVAYADTDTLQTAIAEAIAEVKKLTGSGQVFGQGQTEPVTEITPEEHEQARIVRFNTIMREEGLRPIPTSGA